MDRKARSSYLFKSLFIFATLLVTVAGCSPFAFLFPGIFGAGETDAVLRWNQAAVDASGLDHTPPQPGETRNFYEQFGPTRASRAMAIVHIAMFEAVNAIKGGYQSYTGTPPADPTTSLPAAVAQAAHDTLVVLYPAQKSAIDQKLAADLALIAAGPSKDAGIALGQSTAQAILTLRTNDGSELTESYTYNINPGFWRVDPFTPMQPPVGSLWSKVKPFVLQRANQFRAPPPPDLNSAEYAIAYNETKAIGGDGITTPTIRTAEQTQIGLYWAYDGTPSLCAPPRLYNQLIRKVATDRGLGVVDLSRLLAVANVAMADAAIAIWESKFFYSFWRPVTAIRESDAGTGPTGLGDGNDLTVGDPTFSPLGAPGSNLAAPNFTPPFPTYPSGHAGFGGTLFQVMRDFFGTDNIAFTFVSDELNGVTRDSMGNTRPLVPRSFSSLSQAEEENGQSRIYLGIHWRFDKTEGIALGNRVAKHVFANLYKRLP